MQDHRFRRRRAGEPVEQAHPLFVVANEAGDGDARDVGTAHQLAPAHRRRGRADREHDHGDGDDAPEGELAPHAAAVDDQVGIKRHGLFLYAPLIPAKAGVQRPRCT